MSKKTDLVIFYELIDQLERMVGGKRLLAECNGRMNWPQRGVYFFFENGEKRSDSGVGLRVVRVGTHALVPGSKSTLWKRLSQHRGTSRSGGGNHRGSIFRLLVGTALKAKDGYQEATSWGVKSDPGKAAKHLRFGRDEILSNEYALEVAVSEHIRSMPFLWVKVDDPPGPDSNRGIIERNSIALLSNFGDAQFDAPSEEWLGHNCDRERVRRSGLWNNNHVDEIYDQNFLAIFRTLLR
jgi:hypothetical protein